MLSSKFLNDGPVKFIARIQAISCQKLPYNLFNLFPIFILTKTIFLAKTLLFP